MNVIECMDYVDKLAKSGYLVTNDNCLPIFSQGKGGRFWFKGDYPINHYHIKALLGYAVIIT